jgi:hypothetical protein
VEPVGWLSVEVDWEAWRRQRLPPQIFYVEHDLCDGDGVAVVV